MFEYAIGLQLLSVLKTYTYTYHTIIKAQWGRKEVFLKMLLKHQGFKISENVIKWFPQQINKY